MKKFFKEFKAFISRGNVFDMAVGLIIATAFNKIVSSLVNDIIMPLVTYATGAASLKDLSIPLRTAVDSVTGETVVTLSWAYGNFIQTVLDFLIIAFSVFLMVKVVTASRKKFQELGDFVETQTKKELIAEKKLVRAKAKESGEKFSKLWKEHLVEKARLAEEEASRIKAEKEKEEAEYKLNHPSQEELLTQIRDLLSEDKKNKKSK